MNITKQNKNTWRFIGFVFLAGMANVLSMVFGPEPANLMTVLNYVILTGLLLFWIRSVKVRLLPSAARSCVLGAALLMLLYMLLRIFKYRFAVEAVVKRYAVYSYWLPQMLIPALFLMTGICIRRGEQANRKRWERLLLLPAFLLAVTVMTNDLHFLVYTPKIDLSDFAVNTGTYTYGPVFYLLYVWMVLTFASGFILLSREAGQLKKTALRDLLCVVAIWLGAVLLIILYLDHHTVYRPFNIPEVHTFSLLAVFEICIRYRLIPYNENYTGFFRMLHLPALITDRELQPAYRSEVALAAEREAVKAALTSPVALPGDRMLHGKEIRSGYAFWTEDVSEIRCAQERLTEANETIEQENDLIRAETEQKEKAAYLQSRHRIYHEIAAELYPAQKRIARLLDNARPGTDGFRDAIARVSVLNAYVKRKTNLLLLASEKESLSLRELLLALQESAGYLTLAGMQTKADMREDQELSADRILALYDSFEQLAEQLLGTAPSMMVSVNGSGLRIAVKADRRPDAAEIPLPVRFLESEDVLYITVSAERTGDAP